MIADGAWREVALSDDEWQQILARLGREPSPVELGMFGAMWSEHCGYKHSRPLFSRFRATAPWVIQGPGENAGVVDIGDGLAAVFKVESHNHPSAVEPYEGAATGVGGIVRDIFTMGARPVAILDGLRFGPLDVARNRYLYGNVVAGIGGYGNCLGIPTVGGEVFFDPSFNGNPLVNAMCVGIVPHDRLTRAQASGTGNVLMVVGADTGRDGLHGATFASVDDPNTSHRHVVQVGNPFLERQLLEACLELLETNAVVAMQDLGAAGLTSSVVEAASRGGVGAEIDVAKVPRREIGMTPYEVMLSESQERMLLVVQPEGVGCVTDILTRWSLHAAVIGWVIGDGHVRVRDGEEVVADLPARLLTDEAPTYIRDAAESPAIIAAREFAIGKVEASLDKQPVMDLLIQLLASPNVASRRPIIEQYDHTIQTNTVVAPGEADAAVLRVKGTRRGLAISLDCNSRFCWLDPALGARHAVSEAARNVACTGARPLALTNCLNFGNPQTPSGYYQLREAVQGIADASLALTLPVVSGNVSLYNETRQAAIMPTPSIGVVGVLDDVTHHATMRWRAGDVVLLLGEGQPVLGGSELLALEHGAVGRPPDLDLDAELRLITFVREHIASGALHTAHDVGLGGLAVALTEMAIVSETGVVVGDAPGDGRTVAWFGESATRIIVAVPPEAVNAIEQAAVTSEVGVRRLGEAGGESVVFADEDLPLSILADAWSHGLERAAAEPAPATA